MSAKREVDATTDEGEPDFPTNDLLELDKKISCARWVVPVLPEQELERLLISSIDLARRGLDGRSEACQRFLREGLTVSFTKILTDEAVNSWKPNIHSHIYNNCKLLVELCVAKLPQDCFPLLDLLAILFNPNNKFHTFNSSREPATVQASDGDDDTFGQPAGDARAPRGWLVDLLQQFGKLGGFSALRERFLSPDLPKLTVPLVFALLRPFGLCCDLLTVRTIVDYLLPAINKTMQVLESLTDEELKKEAKNENKNDAIASIIKAAKSLVCRVPGQEETFRRLEMFRLHIILRLLQISSFNGKMSALNEVNKVIGNVSHNIHRHPAMEEEEWLTAERMTTWIKENHVVEIVLRDSLHQPQYVDKLEKLLRFIIKERALTLQDLDHVWAAQAGKHEAIVKNVHDLLAKLAWDFSPEQLDHLFLCFQSSWATANKRQREKLLELIRRLAEDDKDGVMANKVLALFWNLAHSEHVPNDIMDQLLAAHVKILDYSCSQERDVQKSTWLDRCVEELKTNDKWVLPAIKQIREICLLYEQNPTINHTQRAHQTHYRQEVIEDLQQTHSLVILVSENLKQYMDRMRTLVSNNRELDPATFCPDGRYSHQLQVQERLNFLRFLLKDGQLWLCALQAEQIWRCLAEDGIFASDREACFKWFSKLMGEEPDLDPHINKSFFENNVLHLDPTLLTESGMKCFERFFKAVNKMENKLKPRRRSMVMDDPDLIGMDYLWRVITNASDDIAHRAIQMITEVSTNLGSRPAVELRHLHDTFLSECLDRLRTHYDNVTLLMRQDLVTELETGESQRMLSRLHHEAVRLCRVISVLQEYISECDAHFPHERSILPLHRACRGKHLTLTVRLITHMRPTEDIEINTHSNETLLSLRRTILRRIKAYSGKLELSLSNGESREPIVLTEDKKLLSQLPLRDKMLLTAKLCPTGSAAASSPDSSSDSSTSCAPHGSDELANAEELEATLPGVLLSRKGCAVFLLQLSDIGCELRYPPLRDGARALLQLMPPDSGTVKNLQVLIADPQARLEPIFSDKSPTQVLYHAEVLYALLMPAADPLSPAAFEFQSNFIHNGHAATLLNVLPKELFLENADVPTKRAAYVSVLRTCKLVLTVVGHVVSLVEGEGEEEVAARQRQAVHDVFVHGVEPMLRSVAHKLATSLTDQLSSVVEGPSRSLFGPALAWSLPSVETTRSILHLAWAAATGSLGQREISELRSAARSGRLPEAEDVTVAREALQLLSLALVLHTKALDGLLVDQLWQGFVIDLLLLAKNRAVRAAAVDQLWLVTALGTSTQAPLQQTLALLLDHLTTTVMEHTVTCHEYFMLLCRLMNYAHISHCAVVQAERWLEQEVTWLKAVAADRGSDQLPDEAVLEGRLGLACELLGFATGDRKFDLGSNEATGGCLIKELLEVFIFPASAQMVSLVRSRELTREPLTGVCTSAGTMNAAFQLLVALCTDCVPNLKLLVNMLTQMFYSGRDKPLVEWDYLPPLGQRPPRGFVGLKNAGATCYMNSVLQQLFMVDSIRAGVLAAEGAANDLSEDLAGDVEGLELESLSLDSDLSSNRTESRKDYNIGILKQVQVIFGHLACSQLQFYVPRGLWRHFRLQGEPVNLREQQDAVEFFMSLVESVDEALKALGQEQVMSKILGGSYSDQKICKGCPHRYAKEEPFSVISVDIRNHSTLLDSLEQYVKGELLEGPDAYHCDTCNKKRVTVKRLCVKKLPPVLAIQLKRFEYDFDRVCAIKFNDYFEFPRDLDMDPYTVSGLAKLEGELIDCDSEQVAWQTCTKYQLTGIVVHSGQASGGHYYSFILHRLPDGSCKWYKFDDGDVSEWKMDDEDEMKSQCFGGDYMGEVFDNMLKRTSYRRQKRWWNAYMLYYTRLDALHVGDNRPPKMPLVIERGVRRQNIAFLHNRNQFCPEYFQFIKKLLICSNPAPNHPNDQLTGESEELSLLAVQLAARFLFHTGFHTKKSLRGPAMEWYDLLTPHLRHSASVRRWFAVHALFQHPHRFSEYLLGSPTAEVRAAFMKILVFLAHFTLQDGPSSPLIINPPAGICDPSATLSDHLLHALLLLLDKELADHGRYLVHFFSLFLTYASLGLPERAQLLKLNVAETLIAVALEAGPDPNDKYQYPEWSKLHQVVSLLVRCCDVSTRCQSSQEGQAPLPNPFGECSEYEYLMQLPANLVELLYNNAGYMKKLVEDGGVSEEGVKLVQYLSWENPRFSGDVLAECLSHVASQWRDMKHEFDLLLHLLLMEDSWQSQRCLIALQGALGAEPRRGLLDIVARCKNDYQKRAYQCIKLLTTLFCRCRVAATILSGHPDIRAKWLLAVQWLQEELDRRPYGGGSQYSYSNWSPPTQSNESTNGYFLERSNSARKLLERALELCPPEEADVDMESEGVQTGTQPQSHLVNRSYQPADPTPVSSEREPVDHQKGEEGSSMAAFETAVSGISLNQSK